MIFAVNESENQFELRLSDGAIAVIEFARDGDKILLTHTEVPDSHQGKGVGSQLVEKTLEYIKKHDLELVPLCAFVASYVNNHEEWHFLLSDGYQM